MVEWLDKFWQSLHPALQVIFSGLIVAVLVGIGALVIRLIHRLIVPSVEKKKKLEEGLKMHFKELNEEARKIIPNLTELYGAIGVNSQQEGLASLDDFFRKIEEAELPQFSNSFAAHFPGEATKWEKYKGKIKEHNMNSKNFCLKVKEAFTSKGVAMVSIQTNVTPCVYEQNVFLALFSRWERLAQNLPPWIDFKQIKQKSEGGRILLYVEGWGAGAAASVANDADKENYKRYLWEVADDKEYTKEAATIYKSAHKLMEETKNFEEQLFKKLDDIYTFWPTRKHKFEKVKNCPRCKELFP